MTERAPVRKGGGAGTADEAVPASYFPYRISTFAVVNVLMLILGVVVARIFLQHQESPSINIDTVLKGGASDLLGLKGALLFNSLDNDHSGSISFEEFGPIVEKLTGEVPPVLVHKSADGNTGDGVTLITEFVPLVFESMKTYEDEGVEGMMRNFKSMSGLRDWTSAYQPDASFYSKDFHMFLPKAGDEEPGKSYWLYKPHLEPWHHGDSGKYYPPTPAPGEAILYRLMRMFHSSPFLLTRFGPHGSVAVVQAYNDQYYNIKFRMHCEFQVNNPPNLPFWITPAQFTGNLVISKDSLSVKHFNLSLPSDRKLNIDMEWITKLANEATGDAEQMEVEIAYQPKMAIHMTNAENIDKFKWTKSISEAEAVSWLEKAFYPFKEVTYHPFEESFDYAVAEKKLVHSIVLWGSLDDQSC